MNVTSSHKEIQSNRIFKEDDYCNVGTFYTFSKKRTARRQKVKKTYKVIEKKAPKLESISSDTDFNESDDKRDLLYINKSKLSIKVVKHDPVNKEFGFNYEIEMYGPFDYLFELRGNLNKPQYYEKTEKIRNFPKHLKYSLFCNEKIREVRKNEFSMVSSLFDDIKRTGNKMYKNRLYRESIDNYFFAYSMLKWLEFKDEKKRYDLLKFSSLDPIFDEDIYQDQLKLEDIATEEDSYRYSLIYLLQAMSYSFMELRHYREAIDCLDECIVLSGEKLSDPFFRRCQARMSNKFADDEQLLLALADIQKAKSLSNEKIYEETYKKLMMYLDQRKIDELERIKYLISQIRIENNLKDFSNIYSENKRIDYENYEKQFQMLKEMKNKYKLAIKFYTETRNEEQLQIAYKEIDKFYEIYYLYKYYYTFSPKRINKQIFPMLSEEEKILFINEELSSVTEKVKLTISENIFFSGNFNTELYKYASEKVGYRFPSKNETKKIPLAIEKPDSLPNSNLYEKNDQGGSFTLYALLIFISISFLSFHFFWSGQNIRTW